MASSTKGRNEKTHTKKGSTKETSTTALLFLQKYGTNIAKY